MTAVRIGLGLAACLALPAVAAMALAAYVYDRLAEREDDLFAGLEDEVASWRVVLG